MGAVTPLGPAPLTEVQRRAWAEINVALPGAETAARLQTPTRNLGEDALCTALVRIEIMFGIDVDVDEALACPDLAALLALIDAKASPGRAARPRPGHVKVFDLAAYRAAIGRPAIRTERFAHWATQGAPPEQGEVIEEPHPQATDPEGEQPDPTASALARAFPPGPWTPQPEPQAEAKGPTPRDLLASIAIGLLAALACALALSVAYPPAIPAETPAGVALRDAVR